VRRHIFADEAGDLVFTRGQNISKYFIVCAVSMDDCRLGDDLLSLRRQLAWDRVPLGDYFHATTESQAVRDRVFAFLQDREFTVYAQVLEKSKAQPKIRPTEERFYQYAWLYLLRYCMHRIVKKDDEFVITSASLGTKAKRKLFYGAVTDVVSQTTKTPFAKYRTASWSAQSDPCLQIADYCAWAIQRKWERGDARSYDLIKHRISYEYDTWRHGTTHYY
jgi:hypothetical protein